MPSCGMLFISCPARNAGDKALGAGPEAFRPVNFPVFASQYMTKRSPPMPVIIGSVTPRTVFEAMAASTADPPRASICAPV